MYITSFTHTHDKLDNPVTAPGVELEKALVDSSNIQFKYESIPKLETQLQLEYERVGCNVWHLSCTFS